MRVVGVDYESAATSTTYTAFFVKWNATMHAYNNILGT
jgi:hypothetical protein